jgi:hypothetical protein
VADPAAIARWFFEQRGIRPDTLSAWGVTIEGNNVCFPYPNGIKQRPDPTQPLQPEQRRFYFTAGKVPDLFSPLMVGGNDRAFLCEGETDTMRLWQEFQDAGHPTDVFGIGGINTWHPGLAKQLERYNQVFVLLDNDGEAGNDYGPGSGTSSQVEGAWRRIRHDLGGKVKRIPFTGSWKDVCEFFAQPLPAHRLHRPGAAGGLAAPWLDRQGRPHRARRARRPG